VKHANCGVKMLVSCTVTLVEKNDLPTNTAAAAAAVVVVDRGLVD